MIDTFVNCTLKIQYYSHSHQYLTVVGSCRADLILNTGMRRRLASSEVNMFVGLLIAVRFMVKVLSCRSVSCMEYVDF